MGLVSVVLVTWNSAPYLRRCLEGIRHQTHDPIELIVVDNASADESLALVEPAHVIRNETNRGFSAAVNQALRVAKGELVLLVNPDCHLAPDYVERLAAVLRDDVGAATGLLMRAEGFGIEPTNVVDSAGIRMTRSGRHLDIGQGVPSSALRAPSPLTGRRATNHTSREVRDLLPFSPAGEKVPEGRMRVPPLESQTEEVFGVSGAAAMYRSDFLRDVAIDGEVFDEDFFAYREDADLAWRGRLFGWRAVCVRDAVAHHVRRVTPRTRGELSASINMHSVKNRFLLRLKNEGAYLAIRNAPFELARDLVVLAAALTVERTSLPAFAWLWRNRRRVLAKRRAIQSRRKVSDRQLARWFR